MSNIKVLGDLELAGALSFSKNFSDFPDNPSPRTIVVKDGVPYIYTEIANGSGFFSWQPIGVKQASHLHTQGVASTVWVITHNFNSNDFAYFVYDENHHLIIANLEIIDSNSCRILFTSAMIGTAVLFSLQYLNSTTLSATQQLNIGNISLTDNSGVLSVNNNDIAFMANVTAESIARTSADLVLDTKINNIISNTDPIALNSLTELVAAFQASEGSLSTSIAALSTSAVSDLASEITRANTAESVLENSITMLDSSLGTVAKTGSYSDLIDTPVIAITAAQWSINHTIVDGTRYLINDVVYDNGNIYKALYENESIPTSNTLYWQLIGTGSRINIDGRDILNIQFPELKNKPSTLSGYGITDGSSISATTSAIGIETANRIAAVTNESNRAIAAETQLDVIHSTDISNALIIVNTKSPIASPTFTGTVSGIDKVMVGLGNVDNTSDISKPVSIPVQTILDIKSDKTYVDSQDLLKANSIDVANSLVLKADKSYVDYELSILSTSGSLTKDFYVKGLSIAGDILPSISGISNIGSPTDKFNSIYTKELHLDANTLYIDGVPVIGSSANTIQITADNNQGMRIATTGTGQLILDSQTSTTIQTNGTNADVVFQAIGSGSLARISSGTQVVITSPSINIQGNQSVSGSLTVAGNLTVSGTTTAISTANLTVQDNIITVNKGEIGSGVSLRYAGIEVDRGDLARVRLIFDETLGKWIAGQTGQEFALATEVFVSSALSATATASNLSALSTIVSNEITRATAAEALKINASEVNNSLLLKADKTYVDLQNSLKSDQLTTYTKSQVDTAISSATPNFSVIIGKPSTLIGYGITDAMTNIDIASSIGVETSRATTAENVLTTNLTSEISNRSTAITTEISSRNAAIAVETSRASGSESVLTTNLASEISRAITAESLLATKETTYTKTEVDNAIAAAIAAFSESLYV